MPHILQVLARSGMLPQRPYATTAGCQVVEGLRPSGRGDAPSLRRPWPFMAASVVDEPTRCLWCGMPPDPLCQTCWHGAGNVSLSVEAIALYDGFAVVSEADPFDYLSAPL